MAASPHPRLATLTVFRRLTVWLLLSVAVATGAGAHAQTLPVAQAIPDPVTLLLQQATFWRAQNQQDSEAASLRRLLALRPGNPEALGLLAQIDVNQGNSGEAQALLDRLRQVSPTDRRIPAVVASLRIGPPDLGELARARLLASQGRNEDAVQRYQAAFHGAEPLPSLAAEYYFAMGGTGLDGFQAARRALAAQVTGDPDDEAAQLTYARLLCQREFTRADGLQRLQALTRLPAIATAARQVWRETLLWQGPSIETMRQLQTYLASNKSDPQIDALLRDYRADLPTPGQQARNRGYLELSSQQWAQAEADFTAAIADDPRDWRSITMLAAIRNHQKRLQEARVLIQQALAIKPDQHDFILKSSGGAWSMANAGQWTPADARRAAQAAAAAWQAQYGRVAVLVRQGRTDAARVLLARLYRGRGSAAVDVQLGAIQALAGQPEQARASYLRALAAAPSDPDAAAGLARIYAAGGAPDQAAAYYALAEDGYRRAGNQRGLLAMNDLRAQQLRAAADASQDPAQRLALYRQAVAVDPADPWIRLALARALQAQGQSQAASQVMAEAPPSDAAAAIEAQIYFAQSIHDIQAAARFAELLPPGARGGDIERLRDQVALQGDIARIESLPGGADRRAALLALAAHADPGGDRVAAIGAALVNLGEQSAVVSAVQLGLDSTRPPTQAQQVAYAGALVAANRPDEAAALVSGLEGRPLSAEQTAALDDVEDNVAVARADRLNGQKRPADAYDTLAPRLAEHPGDPNLKLALGRLYAANGKPREALQISQSVLADNAADRGARQQAANAALAAHDYPLAARLVRQGLSQAPDDPRLYVLAANLDQAQGANLKAIQDLRKARMLRQRELALGDSSQP
jgi:predicted Zn-dependent protease